EQRRRSELGHQPSHHGALKRNLSVGDLDHPEPTFHRRFARATVESGNRSPDLRVDIGANSCAVRLCRSLRVMNKAYERLLRIYLSHFISKQCMKQAGRIAVRASA